MMAGQRYLGEAEGHYRVVHGLEDIHSIQGLCKNIRCPYRVEVLVYTITL